MKKDKAAPEVIWHVRVVGSPLNDGYRELTGTGNSPYEAMEELQSAIDIQREQASTFLNDVRSTQEVVQVGWASLDAHRNEIAAAHRPPAASAQSADAHGLTSDKEET